MLADPPHHTDSFQLVHSGCLSDPHVVRADEAEAARLAGVGDSAHRCGQRGGVRGERHDEYRDTGTGER